jgi:hypothetical protein
LLVDDRINWLLRLLYKGVHSRKQARLSIGPTGAMDRRTAPLIANVDWQDTGVGTHNKLITSTLGFRT